MMSEITSMPKMEISGATPPGRGRGSGGLGAVWVWVFFLLFFWIPTTGAGPLEAQTRRPGEFPGWGGKYAPTLRLQEEAQQAVGPMKLSIREAVELALSKSLDIQDAFLTLEEAEERVSEAWSSVYPKVDFTGSYTRNIAPMVSFLPAEIFGGEPGEFLKVQFGADNAWASTFVLDQPLFEAQIFIGVGAAGRYKGLQEEVVRGRAQALVTRVRLAYYDLLLAQEDQRLITNSVGRVRQSLEETSVAWETPSTRPAAASPSS